MYDRLILEDGVYPDNPAERKLAQRGARADLANTAALEGEEEDKAEEERED